MTGTIPFSEGNLLRLRATRTEDDIILREIETPECKWSEESSELVMRIEVRHLLEPACIYFSSFEHRMFHVAHARIDIRLRENLEEVGYDKFRSSEVDEPVTDDGDAFRLSIHWMQINRFIAGYT